MAKKIYIVKGQKVCTLCDKLLPLTMFEKRKEGNIGFRSHCKKCGMKYHRNYFLKHREYCNAATRKSYQKHKAERRKVYNKKRQEVRLEVLTYYGSGKAACVTCGFNDIRALSLDHIDGGGKLEERKRKGTNLAPWLKKRGFPTGIQTLCMNCQFIKKLINKEQTKREE